MAFSNLLGGSFLIIFLISWQIKGKLEKTLKITNRIEVRMYQYLILKHQLLKPLKLQYDTN